MTNKQKGLVAVTVGVASAVASTGLSAMVSLTAPISYPLLGGAAGYYYGRSRGVARGEIGPAVCGMAVAALTIPLAPLSLLTAPVTGVIAGINTTIEVYSILNKQ